MSKCSKLNEESPGKFPKGIWSTHFSKKFNHPFFNIESYFELLRGVFWKNKLTKSPSVIFQGILHSISRILTYYEPQTDIPIKSYTRFKFKKIRKKKNFAITNGGTRHVDRVSPSPLASSPSCCHLSNSSTPLVSSLQKQTPSGKSFKTNPFWE